jgi:hypothetical protein
LNNISRLIGVLLKRKEVEKEEKNKENRRPVHGCVIMNLILNRGLVVNCWKGFGRNVYDGAGCGCCDSGSDTEADTATIFWAVELGKNM